MIQTSSSATGAVSLQGVAKRFATVQAVEEFDLVVPRGALYGFIGPNGAGKTTTIRMIMSILFPDRGRVAVLGHRSALEAKDRIGYLPEERGLYRKMRVGDLLGYLARLKGLRREGLERRIRTALERVELGAVERKRCEELSKGMLQKIQFLAAILHEPDLLILDEPFSGLDPISMRLLRELILAEHARGATVLFSTHVMPQAEEICRHVVMIHRGRKVLDADLDEVRRQHASRTIRLEPLDPDADVAAAVAGLPEVGLVAAAGEDGYALEMADGVTVDDAMRSVVSVVTPARIELARPRLEDIFVELVS